MTDTTTFDPDSLRKEFADYCTDVEPGIKAKAPRLNQLETLALIGMALFQAAKELKAEKAEQAARIAELSLDLERTREERNRSGVEARREISKEHRDYIAKLEAQIAALTGKVDGWKLVPIEPTSEMILHNSDCSHHAWNDKECPMRAVRFKVWRNMIASAPATATVAPAVDAQPVAYAAQFDLDVLTNSQESHKMRLRRRSHGSRTVPLCASAQSDGGRKDAEELLRRIPTTPERIIDFIGSHFDRMQAEGWTDTLPSKPTGDLSMVRYSLTVHDLLSAFEWADLSADAIDAALSQHKAGEKDD